LLLASKEGATVARAKLRWSDTKISSFPDGRACLVVQFLDPQGNLFEWVPLWSQVRELFDRAANTEVVNKPDSAWLGDFAETANDVFNKVESLGDARMLEGTFDSVQGGKLAISHAVCDERGNFEDVETEEVPPAFRLTQEFLDDWLGNHVRALVINGYAVSLSRVVHREVPKDPLAFFGRAETVVRAFTEKYPEATKQPA
jgi:hypothetical protein